MLEFQPKNINQIMENKKWEIELKWSDSSDRKWIRPENFLGETLAVGSEGMVHLTIAMSESNSADIGVSGTIEGVADLWGVGSSSMTKTVRFGFGFGSGSVRRFLGRSGNGVEGSSSSERMMGSIVTASALLWRLVVSVFELARDHSRRVCLVTWISYSH